MDHIGQNEIEILLLWGQNGKEGKYVYHPVVLGIWGPTETDRKMNDGNR